MTATTIDFGVGNAERYYSINAAPALPNADWCIGYWRRRDRTENSGYSAQFVANNYGDRVSNYIGLVVGNLHFRAVVLVADASGNKSPIIAALYDDTTDNYLTVLQRRGSNLELYAPSLGATVTGPDDSAAHGLSAGISGTGWYIGADNYIDNFVDNPFGEFFTLLNDSLSVAEITTLAAGAHITAVRASPAIDLRFRTNNNPEPDLSGNGYHATQHGTGWTTAAEFFPDGENITEVTSDSDLRWSILQSIAADSELRWSLLQQINADSELQWSVLKSIAHDLELRWNNDGSVTTVTSDITLQWSIIAAIAQSLTLNWNMIAAVTCDANIRWSVFGTVISDLSTRWHVLEAIAAGAALQWNVIGTVDHTLTLRWNIESDTQFPDITGTITVVSATPLISIASATPITTIH